MKKNLALSFGICFLLAACSKSSGGGGSNSPHSGFVGFWSAQVSSAKPTEFKDNNPPAESGYFLYEISDSFALSYSTRGYGDGSGVTVSEEKKLNLGVLLRVDDSKASLKFSNEAIAEGKKEAKSEESFQFALSHPCTITLKNADEIEWSCPRLNEKDSAFTLKRISAAEVEKLKSTGEQIAKQLNRKRSALLSTLLGKRYQLVTKHIEFIDEHGKKQETTSQAADIKDDANEPIQTKFVSFSKDGTSAKVNDKHDVALDTKISADFQDLLIYLNKVESKTSLQQLLAGKLTVYSNGDAFSVISNYTVGKFTYISSSSFRLADK